MPLLRLVFTTYPNPSSRVLAEAAVTIHNFRQLRKLELITELPDSTHEGLFSSITSTELRKIIIQPLGNNLYQRVSWDPIDKQLCKIVDRLHATRQDHVEVEVELRFIWDRDDPIKVDFTKFLPGFGEKGVVTAIHTTRGGRILRIVM